MLNRSLFSLYEILPISVIKFIKQSKLKQLAGKLLRTHPGKPRMVNVMVNWEKDSYFNFFAPIKIAEKAKNRGIENTLLRNSLTLLGSTVNNRTILDVGANYGFLSLVWATTCCKSGGVFAFEAHPDIAQALTYSVKKNNLQNVLHVTSAAVGDQMGKLDLYLYGTTSNLNERTNLHGQKTEVNMITLDSFMVQKNLSSCDLIKIDTDGNELSVLLGAKELIKKFKPTIVIETNQQHALVPLLIDLEYSLLDMNLEPLSNNNFLPPNIFALPTKKI